MWLAEPVVNTQMSLVELEETGIWGGFVQGGAEEERFFRLQTDDWGMISYSFIQLCMV